MMDATRRETSQDPQAATVQSPPATRPRRALDSPVCPVVDALEVSGGKWKPAILWEIRNGRNRFGLLRRALPDCSRKVLTQQLRQLEEDGIVWRKMQARRPLHVDYGLTPRGLTLVPALTLLAEWGRAQRTGI